MKYDRFLFEVIPKIQDISAWKYKFKTGGSVSLDAFEVENNGDDLIRIVFDRTASWINVVGVVDFKSAEPAVAKLKDGVWNEDIVASIIIACVLYHGLSREDLYWTMQQIKKGKVNRLKVLQQAILRCLVSMRKNNIKHPKYPKVIYDGVAALHVKYRSFPKDDLQAWIKEAKELFRKLDGAGIEEGQILDIWRDSIVSRIILS